MSKAVSQGNMLHSITEREREGLAELFHALEKRSLWQMSLDQASKAHRLVKTFSIKHLKNSLHKKH